MKPQPPSDLVSNVRRALSEDVGTGDITAELLPAAARATASVICREQAVLCGRPWFDEVYRQLDTLVRIVWKFDDGADISPAAVVCTLEGPARALLTGERTALNFLQLLSGTATTTRRCAALLAGTRARLRDTRKTLPGLRAAQKYAVACGGGENHRMGLYDALLIKENHIRATGGIAEAINNARPRNRQIEIEVENLDELQQAIEAGADSVLLDNFELAEIRQAVQVNGGRVRLEASGGISMAELGAVAAAGVDYISMGALTKNVQAVDFSMEFGEGI